MCVFVFVFACVCEHALLLLGQFIMYYSAYQKASGLITVLPSPHVDVSRKPSMFSPKRNKCLSDQNQTFKMHVNIFVQKKSYKIKFLKVGLKHPADKVGDRLTVYSLACKHLNRLRWS